MSQNCVHGTNYLLREIAKVNEAKTKKEKECWRDRLLALLNDDSTPYQVQKRARKKLADMWLEAEKRQRAAAKAQETKRLKKLAAEKESAGL